MLIRGPRGIFQGTSATAREMMQSLVFLIAKGLFRAPEMESKIVFEDGTGAIRSFTSRSLLSQLEAGAAPGDKPIGKIVQILNSQASPDPKDIIRKVLRTDLI
jgi:hypothetical protein